jgi:hypothetical protein
MLVKHKMFQMIESMLIDGKGYEVIPLQIYEGMYDEKFGLSAQEVQAGSADLSSWAKSSGEGERSPEAIRVLVSRIGRPLNADALLVIQGTTYSATVMGKSLLRADLYEVSTGNIVWRSQRMMQGTGMDDDLTTRLPGILATVLAPLERAIPKAVIERRGQ